MTAVILTEAEELVLVNTSERIDIRTRDDNNTPTATTSLKLTVTDTSDCVLHVDAFPVFTLTGTLSVDVGGTIVTGTDTKFRDELDVGVAITFGGDTQTVLSISNNTTLVLSAPHTVGATNASATKPTRIVNPSTGSYYIDWGASGAPANTPKQTETNCARQLLFVWQAVIGSGTEQVTAVHSVNVVPARVLAMLAPFRLLIDKSSKLVSTDPDACQFLGYTDAQLVSYLQQGLAVINSYQPYPTFCKLADFPVDKFGFILYQAGLLAGVMSQQLFAIDTDIPGYSDAGNSFVIAHGPQLAAFLNQVTANLDKMIPQMKLHFVRSGALHIEAGPNWRLMQIIQASPEGSGFRGVYFRG